MRGTERKRRQFMKKCVFIGFLVLCACAQGDRPALNAEFGDGGDNDGFRGDGGSGSDKNASDSAGNSAPGNEKDNVDSGGNGGDAGSGGTEGESESEGESENPGFGANVLWTLELGALVFAPEDMTAEVSNLPGWSNGILAGEFLQDDALLCGVILYSLDLGREVKDNFAAAEELMTADGYTARTYLTNDHAARPAAHALVTTGSYIYYFHMDTDAFSVPGDFSAFIQEITLQ